MSRSSTTISRLGTGIVPTHPGGLLRRELEARSLSANRLAIALRLPSGRGTDILDGKRSEADFVLQPGDLVRVPEELF